MAYQYPINFHAEGALVMFVFGKSLKFVCTVAAVALTIAPAWGADNDPLPEWKDYMTSLTAAGEQSIGSVYNSTSPQDRQDAWNILFSEIARGYLSLVAVDPDHPEFVPTYNTGFNIAAPNPDYIYYATPIDGKGVYRLRGLKGNNRFTFMQITGPTFDDPKKASMSMFNFFRLDQVPGGLDGSFDLVLSAERPKGYTGNWEKLDPRATGMFMRSVAYDWLHERDPVVGIERLDKPAGRGRLTAPETSARLKSLVDFVKRDSLVWWKHMQDLQNKNIWNSVGVEPWGTFPGQVYLEGLYRIADDEALILETTVPDKCLYWSFLVGDMQFRTGDYANNQASINGFQAKLDSDGKFRTVIAKRDPGVPNWLDTSGYNQGVIQGRWNTCSSAPIPTAKLVKLSEVRRNLPADTPVVSAEERDRQLRDRRLGAQLRRKW
jgi:hypothetical protein